MKTTRTVIRLKHSLAANEEINAILPDSLDALEEAIARLGRSLEYPRIRHVQLDDIRPTRIRGDNQTNVRRQRSDDKPR